MSLTEILNGRKQVAFSGTRSLARYGATGGEIRKILTKISPDCRILVGCANGVDRIVRENANPNQLEVFSVSNGEYGKGKSSFARRSVAVVQSLPVGGLLISRPGSVMPPEGVQPRRSFRGFGSGSWGTAAYAIGMSRDVLLYLPDGELPPQWDGVTWIYVDGWFYGSKLQNHKQVTLL
jgi:hypothetical protein